jgi:hypothetical protein
MGLVLATVATLFYAACFARSQLTPDCEVTVVYTAANPSSEEGRRLFQEFLDASRRDCLQQERSHDIRGVAVFGSLAIVCVLALRRERKRPARPPWPIAPETEQ